MVAVQGTSAIHCGHSFFFGGTHLFAKQRIQLGLCFSRLVGWLRVRAFLRFEVIAKICALFVTDLFRNGFAAVLGFAQIVKFAQFADMQIGIALLADVPPRQRQR